MSFSLLELLLACAACSLGSTFALCCTILSRGPDRDTGDDSAPPGG